MYGPNWYVCCKYFGNRLRSFLFSTTFCKTAIFLTQGFQKQIFSLKLKSIFTISIQWTFFQYKAIFLKLKNAWKWNNVPGKDNYLALGETYKNMWTQLKNTPVTPQNYPKPPFTKKFLMHTHELWYIKIKSIINLNFGEN